MATRGVGGHWGHQRVIRGLFWFGEILAVFAIVDMVNISQNRTSEVFGFNVYFFDFFVVLVHPLEPLTWR